VDQIWRKRGRESRRRSQRSPFTNGRFREIHFAARFRTPRERLKQRRLPSVPSLQIPTASLNPHDDTNRRRNWLGSFDQLMDTNARTPIRLALLTSSGRAKGCGHDTLVFVAGLRQFHRHCDPSRIFLNTANRSSHNERHVAFQTLSSVFLPAYSRLHVFPSPSQHTCDNENMPEKYCLEECTGSHGHKTMSPLDLPRKTTTLNGRAVEYSTDSDLGYTYRHSRIDSIESSLWC
jgi:hypothetical protein